MAWMRVRQGYNPEGSQVERRAEAREQAGLTELEKNALSLAIRVTRSAIPDETEAYTMYTGLANNLEMIGERRLSDKVRAIAKDEQRHRSILQDLLSRLESKPR